jgi:hypothetical protein
MRPLTRITRWDRLLIGAGLLAPPPLTSADDWQRYAVAAARRRQVPIALSIVAPALALGAILWMAQPTDDPAECTRLVAQAAAVSEMRDTVTGLDGAIVACPDLTAFAAATGRHPELLGTVPARTWVLNRCQYGPAAVRGSAICSNLAGR